MPVLKRGILVSRKIKISMDGKGRVLDNVFVERLWRTVKQEEVYLKGYQNVLECEEGLRAYFNRSEIYFGDIQLKEAA